MLAEGRGLLKAGTFQCICLLREMNACLIQVARLIEVATKTGFTVCIIRHSLSQFENRIPQKPV